MNEPGHTRKWSMSHIQISHVTHINASWHTNTRMDGSCHTFVPAKVGLLFTPHILKMSHVTRMNESCHTYEWVMSHILIMSHVTHTNESCHIYEWVTSHVRHIYEWVTSHVRIRMSHVSHERVTSYIYIRMSPVTHTHMNESCHTYKTPQRPWMSNVTHTYINKSCHTCTYEWVMLHIYVWMSHVAHTHMNESCHTYEWVVSHTYIAIMSCLHIWMSHVTHVRRLRLVGSLKLDVSLAEHSPFYKALLQKRPIILRSLLIVATPSTTSQRSWMYPVAHTHMNESCHTYTYEWVMSHIHDISAVLNASCRTYTHEWVTYTSNQSCHTDMSHVTHTQMNESCHKTRHLSGPALKLTHSILRHERVSEVSLLWIGSHIWMCERETHFETLLNREVSQNVSLFHFSLRSVSLLNRVTHMNESSSCHTYQLLRRSISDWASQ